MKFGRHNCGILSLHLVVLPYDAALHLGSQR